MSDERLSGCPFCASSRARMFMEYGEALAIWDEYPISPKHALVIPRRHVIDLDGLTASEATDLWSLVADVRRALIRMAQPDGFNIGMNEGSAGGQTVPHLHVHVIPRFRGDVEDPRGGIRWVVPGKAAYWSVSK